MSTIIVATIRCDADDCKRSMSISKDCMMIRCIAEERHGWTCTDDGRDYCDEHWNLAGSPMTLDEVKAALKTGGEERKAAERTMKRSPRR